MRLKVQAPWNGTMTLEKAETMTTPKGQTSPKADMIGMMDMTFKPAGSMLPVDSGSESLFDANSGKDNSDVLSSEDN